MAKRFTCEICGKRFTSYTKNNTKSKFCGVCKQRIIDWHTKHREETSDTCIVCGAPLKDPKKSPTCEGRCRQIDKVVMANYRKQQRRHDGAVRMAKLQEKPKDRLTLLAEEARAHGMDYGTYTALKYVKRMEEEQRQNQQEGQE